MKKLASGHGTPETGAEELLAVIGDWRYSDEDYRELQTGAFEQAVELLDTRGGPLQIGQSHFAHMDDRGRWTHGQ
jgi:hypothetical protein